MEGFQCAFSDSQDPNHSDQSETLLPSKDVAADAVALEGNNKLGLELNIGMPAAAPTSEEKAHNVAKGQLPAVVEVFMNGKTQQDGKVDRFTKMEQNIAMLDWRANRTEVLAMDFKYEIINTAALVSSLRAAESPEVKCWFFPTNFASDILLGKDPVEIIENYTLGWMPPTSSLEHVFIPVHEGNGTWYILLLEVKEGRAHALDVSRSSESMLHRERERRHIMKFMAQIFKLGRNIANFPIHSPYPNDWGRIQTSIGLPTRLNAEESAVWCLSWLLHDGRFKPSIFGNMGMETHVRMKAAMVIVSSPFNEVKSLVDLKSEALWHGFNGQKALD